MKKVNIRSEGEGPIMQVSLSLYVFEDKEDGTPDTYTTFNIDEARAYAQEHHLRIIARIFEYSDSELVGDYRGWLHGISPTGRLSCICNRNGRNYSPAEHEGIDVVIGIDDYASLTKKELGL